MTRVEGLVLTFLANAIWQAPVLVALAWAGTRLLRRAPAAYRHQLWLAALLLAVLSPVASAVRATPGNPPHAGGNARGFALSGPGGAGSTEPTAKRLPFATEYSLGRVGRAAAAAYLLFLLVRAIRLAAGWQRTGRLVRGSVPAPAHVLGAAAECGVAFGREPDVRVSSEVAAPMTFGVRRPVIVLPARFARGAGTETLRGALAHELAHVVRRDCGVNLASECLSLPLSFHPAVRFLKRRLGGTREAACDEAAARLVGPRGYARMLLEVATSSCRPARLAGAVGVLDGNDLEDRMERILTTMHPMPGRRATLALGALLLALGAAARLSWAAGVGVTTEAGPSDMVGRWTATMPGGSSAGQPAAELMIALTPNGPDIGLTLYRYDADGGQPAAERAPVVQHSVKDGVLRFRTRVDDFRLRAGDPPARMEADWQFVVVGQDAGELTLVRNSKLAADEAREKAAPRPVSMKRVSTKP
jgi:beta-lactamase regulating signal transducer with metallopeptidase domain